MILYTKENCSACEAVKAYISTREDLERLVVIAKQRQDYSATYPTLVIRGIDSRPNFKLANTLVITKAANIINFLKTLQVK